ncbi:MAG TPA: D-alanyl-D-alanine carboxypeptidase family protein [Xanthobacteraceae bacterium]|nr:D-alanyl-D-alanine carboxypeptidase family protein [Xanthobacteraceae bacterium]
MHRTTPSRALALLAALFVSFAFASAATPARASSAILIDADSGKVLRAERANYPWYPASTTKLMTLYVTLSAIRDHKITFDTLFAVSPNASAQPPTKMGFPVGTQVTVDNAVKMMMVKSANDMAVVLAEGIGGSVDDFAEQMTDTAHRLGMTESNFVNPNGLPADGHIMSARDLAILARALIHDFPEYDSYWHIPAIKWGRRVVRNYNPLIGRFPGADGMKTGFICASGFNLVATATRDNKHLIAVVLGAPSSSARAIKAAEMLEAGFGQSPLSWLAPSLGTVDQIPSLDSPPPNLTEQMCGRHRKRPATEEDDPDDTVDNGENGAGNPSLSLLMNAFHGQASKTLLQDIGPVTPVVVYTGPTRTPAQVDALAAVPEAVDPPAKKHGKHKAAGDAKKTAAAATEEKKPAVAKPVTPVAEGKKTAKPAAPKAKDTKATTGKATELTPPASSWTPLSSSSLSASPPPALKTEPTAASAPKKPSSANLPL